MNVRVSAKGLWDLPIMSSHGRMRASQRPKATKRACVTCHNRKVRCDGASNGLPCSNCKAADIAEGCIVAERKKRRRTILTINPNQDRQAIGRGQRVESDQQHEHGPLPFEDSVAATPEPDEEPSRDGSVSGNNQNDQEHELAKQHLVGFFSQDLQHSPIRARLTYVGNELSNLNFLTRQRSLNCHVYHYPCDNPYVPRVYKNAKRAETGNPIPKDAFILPPKHIADILVDAFFESIYPTFPVINKEGFLKLYHGANAAPSLLLLQAVLLAGAHAVKVFKNTQELKVALFRRAKTLLEGRYEEDRMEMIQAALLLTWFSDGGDDVCANAWWWIGIAARTAIGLGMHREVGPSKMPEGDKKTWRRMWWCLVQFDCLVSLCSGRSQSINLDDCDVPPLRNEDFELSVSQSDAEFVMKHAELCAIVSDLVRTHFSVKATKSHDAKSKALQTLDARVAEWFVRLPSEFQNIAGGYRSEDSSSANGLLLHLSYNAILTQFHRLLIKGSSEGVTDDESRAHEDICSEASSNTLTIFEQLSRQSSLHRCWFAAPSFLFAAMLQARSQMRSNNPILALKARARETSGLRSLRSLSKHWLFATSVWRLFRSNSISHTATATATPKPSETQGLGGQDSPGQASSIATASSMHLVPMVNSIPEEREHLVQENATADYNGQLDSMSWIQFANPSDSAPANLYTDQGRMQQSLHDWQSVYWSDPLADLSLSGGIGDFNLQWPL